MRAPELSTTSGSRIASLPHLQAIDPATRHEMAVVAMVLPFKVNNYVLDELIDWASAPDDPIFRLIFPNRKMLPPNLYLDAERIYLNQQSGKDIRPEVELLRRTLDPYLDDKPQRNRPIDEDGPIDGLMHKYPDSVLFFPSQGQTCHAHCGYCYRWGQLVGTWDIRQQVREIKRVYRYIAAHAEISDVLISGGDPMIMSADVLQRYIDPLLDSTTAHVRTFRFCTKSLSFWPYRFTTDNDADQLLRLFDRSIQAGRHVAIMAHFSHVRELQTPAVINAIRRLQSTGVVIRAQAPIIRGVNDSIEAWRNIWGECIRLGVVPYSMYVERGTAAGQYYSVPLAKAAAIHKGVVSTMSGLAQTARGPVLATALGKIVLDGIVNIHGSDVFVFKVFRAREPSLIGTHFFAQYDDKAIWLNQLTPALGSPEWYFDGTVLTQPEIT